MIATTVDVDGPFNRPYRITLVYNDKIRPQPDRANAFARASDGAPRLRTFGFLGHPWRIRACIEWLLPVIFARQQFPQTLFAGTSVDTRR